MLHYIDPSKGDDITNCAVVCPVCNARLANLKDEKIEDVLKGKASHHQLSDLFTDDLG
jgi:uncharacterized protein with PIN domain